MIKKNHTKKKLYYKLIIWFITYIFN